MNALGQELISSKTSVESCFDQKDCITVSGSSYLFYDESRNEFYLKIDFADFRNEQDSMNKWLDDMTDSTLFFKAILPKESFPPQSTQNTKRFMINGEVFYNDLIQQQKIDVGIYSTQNSLVVSGIGNLKYDAYKVNFSLPIAARDYKVYKKIMYLNQTITINVTLGRINLLRPGMEFHLKEVYFQSTK